MADSALYTIAKIMFCWVRDTIDDHFFAGVHRNHQDDSRSPKTSSTIDAPRPDEVEARRGDELH
jgi:hypothetical protein